MDKFDLPGAHGFDAREGLDAHPLSAQEVPAGLESLFDGDARADERRARLADDIGKTGQGRAVGKKVFFAKITGQSNTCAVMQAIPIPEASIVRILLTLSA